jgi:hypothetical protein
LQPIDADPHFGKCLLEYLERYSAKTTVRYSPAGFRPPVTTVLPVQCAECGVPIDLQVVDWDPTEPSTAQNFGCPECKAANAVELPGTIVLAVKRIIPRLRVRP